MPKRIYSLDPPVDATVADRRRRLRWSQNRLVLETGLTEGLIAKLETCRVPFTPAHTAAIELALSEATGAQSSRPVRSGIRNPLSRASLANEVWRSNGTCLA
jgi:hypothetical protein